MAEHGKDKGEKRTPHPLDAYDFVLPDACIAQTPTERREDARLLVLDRDGGGTLADGPPSTAATLGRWLKEGDLLVVNATRVLPARLRGHKQSGGRVEALILGRVEEAAASTLQGVAGAPDGSGDFLRAWPLISIRAPCGVVTAPVPMS